MQTGMLVRRVCSGRPGQWILKPARSSGATTLGVPSGEPHPFDKAPSPTVAALPFVNQDGQAVTLDSFKGQTVVLTDFLSLCQEVCPLTAGNFGQIAEKVKTVSYTHLRAHETGRN